MGKKMSPEKAERRIQAAVRRIAGRSTEWAGTSVLVHSDSRGFHVHAGADGSSGKIPDAFHIASVGKLFTAALVARLVDAGRFTLEDTAASLLPVNTLDRLFVVDGVDHQNEVTIAHLLSHTSGAADYWEDPGTGGRTVSRLLVEHPDRTWTPGDLIAFAADEQQPVGRPGDRFHYTDTGYVVLGLIIEAVTGVAYHEYLAQEILKPLGMTRTWMPHRSAPPAGGTVMRPVYLHHTDLSAAASITGDWTGGGIASTEEDLLAFIRALTDGALVAPATLERMQRFTNSFRRGIDYGLGFMRLRFEKFFPLLRGYPRLVGHIGALGTHLFYDPDDDLFIVVTVGSDTAITASIQLLIRLTGIVRGVAPV